MEGSKVKAILQAAADGGTSGVLKQVIDDGKVGVVDDDGSTPLMYAAASGREEVMRKLLGKECLTANKLEKDGEGPRYIDLQNRYGWTALMQAACYGHSDAVLLLLQRGAKVDLVNSWKASCLVLASQGGHFGAVHNLISHGAKVDLGVTEDLMSCTLTPLMAASQCGHVEVVQELLRGGAKLEVKLQATRWTALMFAVLNNKVGAVQQLLQAGADRDVQDIEGKTSVDLATTLGHHGVVTLLAGGTIKNISDSEFFEAVSKGNVSKVLEVLTEKPNMANIEDKDGATPLMFASNKGHCQVCEVLLKAKAEVNTKDRKYGWTALMHATHNKKYEVAEMLGHYGSDVNVRDNNGSTAYDIASVIGDIRMIKLIANITVERLQEKATPTSTEPSKPASSETTPTVAEVSTNGPRKQTATKTPRPLNLSELRSRLQKAYGNPIPRISTPNADSAHSPGPPRFPSAQSPGSSRLAQSPGSSRLAQSPGSSRLAQSPGSSRLAQSPGSSRLAQSPGSSRLAQSPGPPRFPSAQLPSPSRFPSGRVSRTSALSSSGELKPSLAVTGHPSPSKSAGSLPINNLSGRPRPSNPSSQFSKPGIPPSGRDKNTPSHNVWRPRTSTGGGDGSRPTKGGAKGTALRQRANTDSAFSQQLSRGRTSTASLKSVLEHSSMAKYLSVFDEQEMDYESFLSLCLEDLLEMGITDAGDRKELMAIITKCHTHPAVSATGSLSMDSDVFS